MKVLTTALQLCQRLSVLLSSSVIIFSLLRLEADNPTQNSHHRDYFYQPLLTPTVTHRLPRKHILRWSFVCSKFVRVCSWNQYLWKERDGNRAEGKVGFQESCNKGPAALLRSFEAGMHGPAEFLNLGQDNCAFLSLINQ